MDALSPLNLTPKQSLENVPDPYSPKRWSTGGSSASSDWIPVCRLMHLVSVCVCVCVCVYIHTYIFRLELIFTVGCGYTGLATNVHLQELHWPKFP